MEIWFHSKSKDYVWLSNFSRHGFLLNDQRWSSVEHFYQAKKFADEELSERIRNAPDPVQAKKLAQQHSLEIRPDWDEIKDRVMREALQAKFEQNRRLRKDLLATGDAVLIHRSSSDAYWGRAEDGVGENRLGEMLMELRQQLQQA